MFGSVVQDDVCPNCRACPRGGITELVLSQRTPVDPRVGAQVRQLNSPSLITRPFSRMLRFPRLDDACWVGAQAAEGV